MLLARLPFNYVRFHCGSDPPGLRSNFQDPDYRHIVGAKAVGVKKLSIIQQSVY